MKNVPKFISLVIDFGPIVGTVVLGAYVALQANLGNTSIDQSLAWTLTILVLISATQLVERWRGIGALLSKNDEIIQLLKSNNISSQFVTEEDLPSFREFTDNATTIDIVSWSGSMLYIPNETVIQDRIDHGCKIRWVILDKDSDASHLVMYHSQHKQLRSDIETMQTYYETFQARNPELGMSFELRKTTWLVSHSLIIIDGKSPHGRLSVGLRPAYLREPRSNRRHVLLDAEKSPDDFEYFVNLFEKLWNWEDITKPIK